MFLLIKNYKNQVLVILPKIFLPGQQLIKSACLLNFVLLGLIINNSPPSPFFQNPPRAIERYINIPFRKTLVDFKSYDSNILSRDQHFLRDHSANHVTIISHNGMGNWAKNTIPGSEPAMKLQNDVKTTIDTIRYILLLLSTLHTPLYIITAFRSTIVRQGSWSALYHQMEIPAIKTSIDVL